MANIPIRDIPGAVVASPDPSNLIPMDNGSIMQKTTIANAVNVILPLSSQAEAEAGANNAKRMSPLRTKQAIDAQTPAIVNAAITALNLDTMSQEDASDYTPTSGLAAVALSNDYEDLSNLPTLGTAAATDSSDYATAAQGTLASTAVQPGNPALVPAGGTIGQALIKNSGTNYDTVWVSSASATAVSYAPQTLTSAQQLQARTNIGLSNVENTSDADKPISDDTQSALNLKADATNGTISTPTLTLKQSASPTPTAEGDIQWDADDNAIVVGNGGGQTVFSYNKWKTIRLLDLAGVDTSGTDIVDLSDYWMLSLEGEYTPSAAGATGQLLMRLSTDNGANFTAAGYTRQTEGISGTNPVHLDVSGQTAFFMGLIGSNTALQSVQHTLFGFNRVGVKRLRGFNSVIYDSGADATYNLSQRMENKSYAAANAIRFLTNTGTITSGLLHIEGIKA